jgi:hypothetical protein
LDDPVREDSPDAVVVRICDVQAAVGAENDVFGRVELSRRRGTVVAGKPAIEALASEGIDDPVGRDPTYAALAIGDVEASVGADRDGLGTIHGCGRRGSAIPDDAWRTAGPISCDGLNDRRDIRGREVRAIAEPKELPREVEGVVNVEVPAA